MSGRTVHPFPARMAPEVALRSISRHAESTTLKVLDPMCGSGTVLAAATAEGHKAVGFDLDPLAVLMSNVAVRKADTDAVAVAAESSVRQARGSRATAPRWDCEQTVAFAEYWFARDQRVALTRLSYAIDEVEDAAVQDVLSLALSRIIVTKAPKASLAADTSHSRPHRVIDRSDYDVLEGFLGSVKAVARILGSRELGGRASAEHGDARELDIRSSSIDLVVTSPPYLNAIDYLRGHRLALIWLGYSIPTLRAIRSDSIGAERAPDLDTESHVASIVDAIHRLVAEPAAFPRKIVERYAIDLTLFAGELFRVCRKGARVVIVIGNSTLRGNFIRNDLLVGRALRSAGFEITSTRSRELPETRRYLPVRAQNARSTIGKRMRTEVVMNARKPS